MSPPQSSPSLSSPRLGPGAELACALLLAGLPLMVFLGSGDFGNDEAIYAFAARKIVELGHWMTARGIYDAGATPFLEKPPLKFWLVAAGLHAGLPDTAFGHRFFDGLFGLGTFAYLVALGRRLGGPGAGLLAVVAFFGLQLPILRHGLMSANMESCLMLQYAGSLHHLLAWAQGGSARRHAAAIYALFVLGFMTKFVAALFVPMVALALLLLEPALLQRVRREWRVWAGGALAVIAFCAPWFAYQHVRLGDAFWDVIFGDHVVRRLAPHPDPLHPAHLRPWYAYLVWTGEMLTAGGTWLALALGVGTMATRWRERRLGWWVLLLAWGIPMAALSAMTQKLIHYLHPFLLPLAVWAGVGAAAAARAVAAPAASPGRRGLAGALTALTLVPLALGALGTVDGMRARKKPFEALVRCLDEIDAGRPLAFFYRYDAATHAYAFYDVAEYREDDPGAVRAALLPPASRPVWLSPAQYAARFAGPEAESVAALDLESALLYAEAGGIETAVLLLPGASATCRGVLEAEGATPRPPGGG